MSTTTASLEARDAIDLTPADAVLSPETLGRRAAQRRKMLLMQAVSYAVDAFILGLFVLAGTTTAWVAGGYLVCGLGISAAYLVLSETHVNDRFRDHYLTTPQSGANALIQFGFLYLAPEVGLVFLCVLFIIFGFATLRISVRQALIGWTMTTLFIAAVLLLSDTMPAIPAATPAERLVTLICFSLSVGRFVYLGLYGNAMRTVLYERSLELKRANRRIEELAEIDELTGAFNRRRMMRSLDEESIRVQRSGSTFSVALIDLDFFKRINDRYGHPTGDEVLRTFAITIFANIRATDKFGRYGGEEFLLLMPDTPNDVAAKILDRLRVITAELDWSAFSNGLSVTISAGVATMRPNETSDSILARADAALYVSKDSGRNRISTA